MADFALRIAVAVSCSICTPGPDSDNTARIAEDGTLDTGQVTLAADDLLEIVIVATVGTGTLATGPFVDVVVEELGAP